MALRPTLLQPLPYALASALTPGLIDVIDFDSVPSGTMIDTHYAPNGVTFTTQGHVFAATSPLAETPRNTVSIVPQGGAFNESNGVIRATFGSPQSYVSIDARPVISAMDNTTVSEESKPYLKIYGPNLALPGALPFAALLAIVYFPLGVTDGNFASWQPLEYVSPAATPNITSVVFSCGHSGSGGSVYSFFDHLMFSKSPPSHLLNLSVELG